MWATGPIHKRCSCKKNFCNENVDFCVNESTNFSSRCYRSVRTKRTGRRLCSSKKIPLLKFLWQCLRKTEAILAADTTDPRTKTTAWHQLNRIIQTTSQRRKRRSVRIRRFTRMHSCHTGHALQGGPRNKLYSSNQLIKRLDF